MNGGATWSPWRLHGQMMPLYNVLQGADAAPTSQGVEAVEDVLARLAPALERTGGAAP